MELNITAFFNEINPRDYSNSIMESGLKDIAQITWNNAKNSYFSLVTESNREEVIAHFKEYGAWDNLDDWSINELNALLIQDISADINEFNSCDSWEDYERQASDGRITGRMFRGDGGKVYFILGV